MQWPSLADCEDLATAENCTAGNRRNTPKSTSLLLTPVTDARLNLHHSADVLPVSSIMPELNWSLRLSNPSLQTGSTRSPENENLSSETRAQLAHDVSKFGVSETRSLAPWPAKSRTCRGLFLRLKMYQKQLVSVVADAVSINRSLARFSLSEQGKMQGKFATAVYGSCPSDPSPCTLAAITTSGRSFPVTRLLQWHEVRTAMPPAASAVWVPRCRPTRRVGRNSTEFSGAKRPTSCSLKGRRQYALRVELASRRFLLRLLRLFDNGTRQ